MDNNNSGKESTVKTQGKKRTFIMSKIMVNLLLIVAGAILSAVILGVVQTRASWKKQQENSELALSEVVSILQKNADNAADLTEIYHNGIPVCGVINDLGTYEVEAYNSDVEDAVKTVTDVLKNKGIEFKKIYQVITNAGLDGGIDDRCQR